MVQKIFVALIAFTLRHGFLPPPSMRGPSTRRRTRASVLDYARSLEQHPLAHDSLQKRMWLRNGSCKSPDVFNVCCMQLKHWNRWTR